MATTKVFPDWIAALVNAAGTAINVTLANAGIGANATQVQGTVAPGSAVAQNPVQLGVSDGTNVQRLGGAIFHNADNQSLPSSLYGLLSGGVAQILNQAGNVDRQRGTGFDGVPAVGIATGAQQLAGPQQSTTFNGAVTGSASAQSVAVASSANAVVGDIVITQDNVEYVEITAIADGTHVTGIFKNNHANGQTLKWYHYNQARDATIGDATGGTGLSPSATYLYNNVAANFEYDRSANGEKDGASGQGTAVAAEYEWNAGGPYSSGSSPSGLQFDRARNVQGKGFGSGTISNNPLAAGATTLTLNAGPTTLQPGQAILIDRAGTNPEGNYVGTGYTAGSTSVPLQSATAFQHAQNATVEWDQFAANGPGTSGFTAAGVGIEEEALYNPVDGKFYLERAATQDAAAGANIVLENAALYNGTTFDRQRAVSGDAMAQTGIEAAADVLYNGATFDRPRSVGAGATGLSTGVPAEAEYLYNGSTWDAAKSVAGDAQSATGIGADAAMLWNGATYDRLKGDSTGAARVSLYGKNAAAGDTSVSVDSGGIVNAHAYDQVDALYSGATSLTPSFATIVASASGATTVVAAVGGKRIVVLSYVLVANAAVNVKFQSHVGPTDITGLLYLGANGGVSSGYCPVGHFRTLVGEALDINLSGAIAVGGHLTYVTV